MLWLAAVLLSLAAAAPPPEGRSCGYLEPYAPVRYRSAHPGGTACPTPHETSCDLRERAGLLCRSTAGRPEWPYFTAGYAALSPDCVPLAAQVAVLNATHWYQNLILRSESRFFWDTALCVAAPSGAGWRCEGARLTQTCWRAATARYHCNASDAAHHRAYFSAYAAPPNSSGPDLGVHSAAEWFSVPPPGAESQGGGSCAYLRGGFSQYSGFGVAPFQAALWFGLYLAAAAGLHRVKRPKFLAAALRSFASLAACALSVAALMAFLGTPIVALSTVTLLGLAAAGYFAWATQKTLRAAAALPTVVRAPESETELKMALLEESQ